VSLRVLIVDDEHLARARLRRLLRREHEVEVVGDAESGEEALAILRDQSPDAMFLDVQMPGLDGFGVLRACGPDRAPLVVFVTAWEEHALRAFEVNAVDYLLKPYPPQRVREACRRLLERFRTGRVDEERDRLRALIDELRPAAQAHAVDRLLVPVVGGARVVHCSDIDWIGSAGNYVELHVGPSCHLLRETLATLGPRLDPRRFVRIHRSTLVNVDRVREVHPLFAGDAEITLADDQRLRVSRTYRAALEARLDGRR
jgi:two-component system LytT family response regulator